MRGTAREIFHRLALKGERLTDRLKPDPVGTRVIDPYIGYSTHEHLILRGRVLTEARQRAARPDTGPVSNFRDMLSLFMTDEVAGVTAEAGGVTTITDEEGYYTLTLPRPETTGWTQITVHLPEYGVSAVNHAFVPDATAELMIISDIDDTVLKTNAWSLVRNLWTSLTGSVLSREIHEDARSLIDGLSGNGRNPVYYVSSSPWNMHAFLDMIFERTGLTRGPMFLRDLGLSETKLITEGHGSHKGGSIRQLLEAHPGLTTVLLGDTGQKDSEIYAGVVHDYPGRVSAVVLRETQDGSDDADTGPMAEMRKNGVVVFHGPRFPDPAEVISEIL